MQVADRNRDARTLAVLAVVCLVLQLALAPNVGLGNGRANFALVFALCVALQQGGRRAVIAGFAAGLVFDLSTTGPVGLMAFCLTVSSYVMGLGGRDRMSGDLASAATSAAACIVAVSLAYHLAMFLVGQASSLIDVVVFRTLPTALLTFVAFLPFAYYFSRVRSSGGSGLGIGSGLAGAGRRSKKGLSGKGL